MTLALLLNLAGGARAAGGRGARAAGGARAAPKPAKVVPEKVDVLITSTTCAADLQLAQSIKGEWGVQQAGRPVHSLLVVLIN